MDEAIDDAMGGSEDEEESEEVMNQVFKSKTMSDTSSIVADNKFHPIGTGRNWRFGRWQNGFGAHE